MQPRGMRRAWRQDMKRRARKGSAPAGDRDRPCAGADERERYTMEAETQTKARRVRVILEGDATPVGDGPAFKLRNPDLSVLLHPGACVSVEEITPPRVWTDGDVVQAPDPAGITYHRDGGEWVGIGHGGQTFGPHDDEATSRDVGQGFLRVLRYQVGEQ